MAKKPGLDVKAQGGLSELKSRLLFVLGAIIVFRAGSYVPIPGIDAAVLAELFQQQKGTIIEMFNMFSGGALSRFYSCAGDHAVHFIDHYPAADCGSPALAELKKEGESGRRKISQYTRWGTLVWERSRPLVLQPVCRI